ncbi:MAG: hypothetical protein IT198_16760 [Acidimicrobiia bacterium]|nr:hypothetical protein [Acidimicrobiia bacterium]
MRRLGLVLVAGVAGFALVACGSGGDVESPAATSTSAPSSSGTYGGSGVPYGPAVDRAGETADEVEQRTEQLEQAGEP